MSFLAHAYKVGSMEAESKCQSKHTLLESTTPSSPIRAELVISFRELQASGADVKLLIL